MLRNLRPSNTPFRNKIVKKSNGPSKTSKDNHFAKVKDCIKIEW